jgi:hypothetical protein
MSAADGPAGSLAAPPPPASVASAASSSRLSGDRSCRVCWGGDEDGNPLIQPCQCRGSLAFIHRRCLQQWRQVCRENGRRRKAALCDICGAPLVLPGSRLAALAAARRAGGVGMEAAELMSTDEDEEDEEGDDGEENGERRRARRADAADRRLRRMRHQRRRRRNGEDDDDDDDDDDLDEQDLGPFFGNGQLVPALDLGAVLADGLRDPLWWAGALHGALRAYVALTGVAAAWRVWAQVLRAKRSSQGGGGAMPPGASASAQVAAALRAQQLRHHHHPLASGVGGGGTGGGHFLQHPHFAFATSASSALGGAATPAAVAATSLPALPAAVPVGPPSASALQAAAQAAQAAAAGGAAAPSDCPPALLLRPYIVREFTQAVEQGAQFQVAAHTTLAALASGADADAYSGLALGAVVASAVSELVFLPLLGAGKRGAANAVARLVGRTAWRLAAGALCTRDGYRLFCRGCLAVADAVAGWRARRRRRARRLARARLLVLEQQQQAQEGQEEQQVVVVAE